MPKTVVEHEKDICIGCGACAAVSPVFWIMEGDKAALVSGKDQGNNVFVRELSDSEVKTNQDAADSCPVTCIHVKKIE